VRCRSTFSVQNRLLRNKSPCAWALKKCNPRRFRVQIVLRPLCSVNHRTRDLQPVKKQELKNIACTGASLNGAYRIIRSQFEEEECSRWPTPRTGKIHRSIGNVYRSRKNFPLEIIIFLALRDGSGRGFARITPSGVYKDAPRIGQAVLPPRSPIPEPPSIESLHPKCALANLFICKHNRFIAEVSPVTFR